jgi:hypothetical protein
MNTKPTFPGAGSPTIVSAQVGPMPRPMPAGMFDPMPAVRVDFSDGSRAELFAFYPDEIQFQADEFVGLTREEAMALRHKRDVNYLRQR